MNKFGYTKEVKTGFLETVDDVMFSLKEQGFGVVHKIDIQQKISDKIGVDIGEYLIIGACNPIFAYDALQLEYELGLFFPCNIIVYKKDDKVFVSCILPSKTMNVLQNEKLENLAKSVEEKLKNAINNL
ncbi:MAG: DUF302 domain-containing protein [Candidatus Gracilibacteria bacterium]|nr:DUF302 domain-containing protein [Candidatus Gracilibacteria bacterium]